MGHFSQYNIDGKTYHRVTHIIKCTKEDATERRRLKLLEQIYIWRPSDKKEKLSLERGIKTHQDIQNYLQFNLLPSQVSNDFKIILPYLIFYKDKTVAVEKEVHSKIHGYAGTLDLLLVESEGLVINDWVTSYRQRKREGISHKFLQVAAYAVAYEEMTNNKINQLKVTVIGPKKVQTFSESPEAWVAKWYKKLDQFNQLKEKYKKTLNF